MKLKGRPQKYDNDFYLLIFKEFEEYSLTELSKIHNVSKSTIQRWVRRGKEIEMLYDKQQKSNE